MKKKKSKIIFFKISVVFLATVLGLLIVTLLTINQYYVSFLKEEKIKYNQQLLSKVYYDVHNLYIHSDYLIDILDNEEKYAIDKFFGPEHEETLFDKIKQEIDFEEEIIRAVYTNGLGEYTKAVLIFDNNGNTFCTDKGALDIKIIEDQVFGQITSGKKQKISTVKFELEGEVYAGLLRNNSDMSQHSVIIIDYNKIAEVFKSTILDNRSFFVRDNSGECIYKSNMDELEQKFNLSDLDNKELESSEDFIVTSTYLDLFDGKLYVVDRPKIIFQDIDSLWRKVGGIIVIGSVAGTILFLYLSRRVLFPISQIKKMIHEVEQDYDTYLRVDSNDELGEIAENINYMKNKIKRLSEDQMLLEIKTTEARLQALQAQINPHFLYNTLDNIYCIAQIEEIEPITILSRNLSEMLRYSINTEDKFVTLSQEVSYIKSYLKIINVRYDDIIDLVIDIPEDILSCFVFRLSLQPLVENACLHGILPSEDHKGKVYINASKEGDDITIKVINSGVLLSDKELEQLNRGIQGDTTDIKREYKGNGIALSNVNERIQLFFGPNYGLEIKRLNGYGTCALVKQRYNSCNPDRVVHK